MTLKLVREQLTLVYGLQLFQGRAAVSGEHPRLEVQGPDGQRAAMAVHTISGTRDEIREQLLQSIDAFFELVEPAADV